MKLKSHLYLGVCLLQKENCRSLFSEILGQHNAYLNAPNDIQTDIDYITGTVFPVFAAFSRAADAELLLLPAGGSV